MLPELQSHMYFAYMQVSECAYASCRIIALCGAVSIDLKWNDIEEKDGSFSPISRYWSYSVFVAPYVLKHMVPYEKWTDFQSTRKCLQVIITIDFQRDTHTFLNNKKQMYGLE